MNYHAMNKVKGAKVIGFPLDIFERAIRPCCVRSTRWRFSRIRTETPAAVLTLSGRLSDIERRIEGSRANSSAAATWPRWWTFPQLGSQAGAAMDELEAAQQAAALPFLRLGGIPNRP